MIGTPIIYIILLVCAVMFIYSIRRNKGVLSLFKVHYGKWSVEGEKLRIITKNGESSVLFEDTASIAYEKTSQPNWLWLFLGLLVGLIASDGEGPIYLIISVALGFILTIVLSKKHDVVSVETKGGKILNFSTAAEDGKQVMEKIESAKRDWRKNNL